MKEVKAKKSLGQHFLCDETIAQHIVDALQTPNPNLLEIGPGMGVLTKYLLHKSSILFQVVEIDKEAIEYLNIHYPSLQENLLHTDFLKLPLSDMYQGHLTIIGNFPYNISSQILFKILENKDLVTEMVGMFQKEVAERIASMPGNKHYGILSVLLQAFFDIEYLFTVHEHSFNPPPKVKSAVIRLKRNFSKTLRCDEMLFKNVIKTAFNQRRKTLRNSLKNFVFQDNYISNPIFSLRPEQLSVTQFEELCLHIVPTNHSII